MFKKILIANRGEIAVRVMRACKEMGISSVAVFSSADKDAFHVSFADESYCIGGPQSKDSYLNMKAVISAAIVSGAEAIHPGYGFLSENVEFAKLCAEHDIVFIGPNPDTIEKMGDKNNAKITMKNAGVPCIPGCELIPNAKKGLAEAKKIGFPVLIKARSGGGGRGIRIIEKEQDFESNFLSASTEAQSAFGDSGVYLEKFLTDVKHIEVQILGDKFGNIVCLGERDCSMQRRNQKLIEETPANISDAIRKKMIETSIKAGKAVNYVGAGTIEYLFKDEQFYFMEMNTRLQVEHPVTEMVTQIDLVKWQIRIAAGLHLGFKQSDIKPKGHSIECRINSENPYDGFKPSCGKIEMLHIPNGPWVRFDTMIYNGYNISPFYDSMIGKLIVWAATRDEAIRKMKASLCELIIEGQGIVHNADFQNELIDELEFENAGYTTSFLNKFFTGKVKGGGR